MNSGPFTAGTVPVHDPSYGELTYGHLVRDGSRWVKIGTTYGYPGPTIYTVRGIYGGITYFENFRTTGHRRFRDPFPGVCNLVRKGPGHWDSGETVIETAQLLAAFEPFRSRILRGVNRG